jgi:hypothetical protein
MKKVKRYRKGDVVDQPTPERPTATAADVRNASNLYYNDNNEIRSGLRNPGPFMAANRLETQGVDIPGLIGNRPGVGMDMGETIPNPDARTWRRPLPGMAKSGGGSKSDDYDYDNAVFKRGGAIKNKAEANVVKKMAKGGATGSASKRADGCAQRGKTKGRFV